MKKSFLGISVNFTIGLLSLISVFFTFVNKCGGINSIVSFIIVITKALIFVTVPFVFYVMEKKDLQLKKVAGIYTSYFVINFIVTGISALSISNNFIPFIILFVFDLNNLFILLTGVCIFIEQVLIYSDINNRFYNNVTMKLVYKIGEFISYPVLRFINKKSGKE